MGVRERANDEQRGKDVCWCWNRSLLLLLGVAWCCCSCPISCSWHVGGEVELSSPGGLTGRAVRYKVAHVALGVHQLLFLPEPECRPSNALVVVLSAVAYTPTGTHAHQQTSRLARMAGKAAHIGRLKNTRKWALCRKPLFLFRRAQNKTRWIGWPNASRPCEQTTTTTEEASSPGLFILFFLALSSCFSAHTLVPSW